MSNLLKLVTVFAAVVLVVFAYVAMNRGVKLHVVNRGDVTLEDVAVRISGKFEPLGDVAPGETLTRALHTDGEVGRVELTWAVGGRESYARVEGYFESSGYNGSVVFVIDGLSLQDTDFDVEIGFF